MEERGGYELRTANAQFAHPRISEKLDVLDALSQFVESGKAAPLERSAIRGRLDALSFAIEQPHAQRVLKVGDDLGHGRLRDAELLGRLGHASDPNDRRKHVEIAQTQAPANLAFPVDLLEHRMLPI